MTPLSAVELHWIWPPVLAILLWVLRKPPRGNGIAFVALGTLVGYGVQCAVSYFVVQLPAWVPKNFPERRRLLGIMVVDGYRTARSQQSAHCLLSFGCVPQSADIKRTRYRIVAR